MRAAIIQLPQRWAESPQEFFTRVDGPLAIAAREGVQLAVLPYGSGDWIAGIAVPLVDAPNRAALAAAGGFASWLECARRTSAVTAAFYVHTFEALAQRHSLALVPGTIHLPGDAPAGGIAPVFNAAFVFGSGGEVLGEQRQMRPAPYDEAGLAYGNALNVIDTPVGRLAIVIGVETGELLQLALTQRAQYVLVLGGQAGSDGLFDTRIVRAGADASTGNPTANCIALENARAVQVIDLL